MLWIITVSEPLTITGGGAGGIGSGGGVWRRAFLLKRPETSLYRAAPWRFQCGGQSSKWPKGPRPRTT
jgi:hypothetical protein